MKQEDTTMSWKGFWNCDSRCRTRIYFPPVPAGYPDIAVVIATELKDNPGTSITNDAEKLIKLVCDRFELDSHFTIWVEHYPKSGGINESFSKVCIQFGEAKWEPLSISEVEQLIGGELDA